MLRLPTRSLLWTALFFATTLTFVGCDMIGEDAGSNVLRVGFEAASTGDGTTSTSATAKADGSLNIGGSNGTLTLEDIRLVVSGIELEGNEEEDDGGEEDEEEENEEEENEEEEEYETGPSALDLPLETPEVAVAGEDDIGAGTYSTFEFEVEDVESDDDDEGEEQRELRAALDTLREDYPEWPNKASMVAVGTFISADGSSSRFKVFFNAEIEVERPLDPPLTVTADGPSRSLTVEIDPTLWFKNDDGSVDNLAESDWDDTQELVEFEAEFEDGITEVEPGDEGEED